MEKLVELYVIWVERINVVGRDHLMLNVEGEDVSEDDVAGPSLKKVKVDGKKKGVRKQI